MNLIFMPRFVHTPDTGHQVDQHFIPVAFITVIEVILVGVVIVVVVELVIIDDTVVVIVTLYKKDTIYIYKNNLPVSIVSAV